MNDTSENPRVRGYAAEALHLNHRKKSHDVLLKNLTDPSKQVRFWCAYTLGQMAERRAIPRSRAAFRFSDNRVVTGYHSVAKEAADALEEIKAAKAHRREQGCISCIEYDCQGRSCC